MLKGISKKRFVVVLAAVALALLVSFFWNWLAGIRMERSFESKPEAKTVTALNEPCESSLLKVTATDIKAVSYPSGSDTIVIGVYFVVENVGNDTYFISTSRLISYVDDVAANISFSVSDPWFPNSDMSKDLGGEIVPGKRAEGYYCVDASKEAQTIEIHFQDLYDNSIAIFRLPVPPVEDVDSE